MWVSLFGRKGNSAHHTLKVAMQIKSAGPCEVLKLFS